MNRLVEPIWVQVWRAQQSEEGFAPDAVKAVCSAARSGHGLAATADMVGLDQAATMRIVSTVGSRCTQIGKHATKVKTIVAAPEGARSRFREIDGGWEVQASAGWLRSRRQGDIRRAYAALLVAEDSVAAAAVSSTLESHRVDETTTYTHFSDLHGAARGVLPPLHLVVTSPAATPAYLAAFKKIDDCVVSATAAIDALLNNPSPMRVPSLLREAFWLVPSAGVIDRWARACIDATDGVSRLNAERMLNQQLFALRHLAQRNPRRLYPRKLEDLSIVQVRALAATFKLHPADGSHAREETTLAAVAAEARLVLAAEKIAV